MLTLLVIAAEALELKPLLRRCRDVHREQWPVSWGWSGTLGDCRLLLAANGAGSKLARQAAEASGVVNLDAVVSTGLCGAVDPSLRLGDIVAGTAVNGVSARVPQSAQNFHSGPVASVDRFLCTAKEKAGVRASGAIAVEMEAAGVAEFAVRRRLPLYCLRAVSDTSNENFAFDFNNYRDAEGRFAKWRIAMAAIARPWERIPELVRFSRRGAFASNRLGEFFASCRF